METIFTIFKFGTLGAAAALLVSILARTYFRRKNRTKGVNVSQYCIGLLLSLCVSCLLGLLFSALKWTESNWLILGSLAFGFMLLPFGSFLLDKWENHENKKGKLLLRIGALSVSVFSPGLFFLGVMLSVMRPAFILKEPEYGSFIGMLWALCFSAIFYTGNPSENDSECHSEQEDRPPNPISESAPPASGDPDPKRPAHETRPWPKDEVFVSVLLVEENGTKNHMIARFDEKSLHERSVSFFSEVSQKCAAKNAHIEEWITLRSQEELEAWQALRNAFRQKDPQEETT